MKKHHSDSVSKPGQSQKTDFYVKETVVTRESHCPCSWGHKRLPPLGSNRTTEFPPVRGVLLCYMWQGYSLDQGTRGQSMGTLLHVECIPAEADWHWPPKCKYRESEFQTSSTTGLHPACGELLPLVLGPVVQEGDKEKCSQQSKSKRQFICNKQQEGPPNWKSTALTGLVSSCYFSSPSFHFCDVQASHLVHAVGVLLELAPASVHKHGSGQ